MKSSCKIFSEMSVTFRDESNEPSSTMIGNSGATVTAPNYSWSKTLLATAHATVS